MEWVVLLPVKTARTAKSRLAPAFPDPDRLATLVTAMRRDTVEAVRNTRAVVGIIAAVDRVGAASDLGAGIDVVVQRDAGLNAALREADTFASLRFPELGRIAVVGDLPALTPDALRAVLMAAEGHARSFVPDLAGTGTTMLAVTSGPLDPRFGPGSAARHAETATALTASASARHDVDVPADLAPSMVGGFGTATRAVLVHDPADGPVPSERVGCPGT